MSAEAPELKDPGMDHAVRSAKRMWAEKKRHGSEKDKVAAVSVQVGRIADKLFDKAGSENLQFTTRDDYLLKTKVLANAKEEKVRTIIPGKKKTVRRVDVENTAYGTLPLDHSLKTKLTSVDVSGKKRPYIRDYESKSDGHMYNHPGDSPRSVLLNERPTADQITAHTAPILYEIKKQIDDTENEQAKAA